MSDVEEVNAEKEPEVEQVNEKEAKAPKVDGRKKSATQNLINARAVRAANLKNRQAKLAELVSDESESDHEIKAQVNKVTGNDDNEVESESEDEDEDEDTKAKYKKVIKETEKKRKDKKGKNVPIPYEVYDEMEKMKAQLAKNKYKAKPSKRKVTKKAPTKTKEDVMEENNEVEVEEPTPKAQPKKKDPQIEHLENRMDHLFKF